MRHPPASLYRLQLRGEVDFAAAERLIPYLAGLGISHLYLSPVFTAQPGSSHGYDVIDPTAIDPTLGGREGFERLAAAASGQGLGIVLDIVPNHMAFTLENPWLRDVLARGDDSRYRHHFDILPGRRLALPMLQAPFEEVLAEGGFAVEADAAGPVLVHGPLRVPLDPRTLEGDGPVLDDRDAIRRLHDRQFWRLTAWRTERDAIAHRRFFNISGLIGVRVEDEPVFEDTHRLIFDLADHGLIAGLRIDHIDGLADPGGYLDRIAARLPETPVWVEKILAPGETLPDWPVAGTTGYVLARDVAQVLTGGDGAERLAADYRRDTGRCECFTGEMVAAKREMLETELAAELWHLHALLCRAAAADPVASEYGPETWRRTILDLVSHFGRYRPYLTGAPPRAEDARSLESAADRAAAGQADRRPLDFLLRCLLDADTGSEDLRTRFQQIAGAVMAKGQEDTAFYRYNALLSANEVGGDPERPSLDVESFHARMAERRRLMPLGLNLTSGHDTKRSEDARMRIAALTHHPEAFAALMEVAGSVAGADTISASMRWYLVQSLWAIHPGAPGTDERAARLRDHATKAMREAKIGTTWQDPCERFENAVREYAARLVEALTPLPPQTGAAAATARRLSLSQLVLKLTVPGIPDIYQGCEIGNFRLTDPDNRAPVDFARLGRALDGGERLSDGFDRAKLGLAQRLLALRRNEPGLFAEGSYDAAPAAPGNLAFRRRLGGRGLRVVVSLGPALGPDTLRPGPQERPFLPGEASSPPTVAAEAVAVFVEG